MQRPDSTNPAQRENVATLRAHWDPVADTFPKHLRCEGLCARMYRAFSWLERVEQLDGREGKDSAYDQLVFSWTALNSLYGRWDPERQEPASDIQCLKQFFDDLFEIDEGARLAGFLEQNREAVMAVFDNQFLARQFWNAPDLEKADKRPQLRHKASSGYIEKRYSLMLEKLVLNIYLSALPTHPRSGDARELVESGHGGPVFGRAASAHSPDVRGHHRARQGLGLGDGLLSGAEVMREWALPNHSCEAAPALQ